MDAWVAESMNHVENASAPVLWNPSSRWAVRYIHQEVASADVNLPEIQTGSGLLRQSMKIRVHRLVPGHGDQIDAKLANCCDDGDDIFAFVVVERLVD